MSSSTITVIHALREHRKATPLNLSRQHPGKPIDLTVAVISLTVDHASKHAQILIGDHSLQRHECARIQFWNMNRKDMEKCAAIRKGDIVRFNGVIVREEYRIETEEYGDSDSALDCDGGPRGAGTFCQEDGHGGTRITMRGDVNDSGVRKETGSEGAPLKSSTVICDFQHSFLNPQAVQSFAKVATITPMNIGFRLSNISSTNNGSMNMNLTSQKEIIEKVASWFHEHHLESNLGLGCFDANEEECSRCQRRNMRELNKPNLLSDILVRVLHMDSDDSMKQLEQLRGRQKHQRSASSDRVILVDGGSVKDEEDSIPLLVDRSDLGVAIMKQLRQSFHQSDTLFLRRVLTKRESDWYRSRRTCNGGISSDLILVTTNETTIERLSTPLQKSPTLNQSDYSFSVPSSCPSPSMKRARFNNNVFQPGESLTNSTVWEISALSCIHFPELGTSLEPSSWPSWFDISRIILRPTPSDNLELEYRPAVLTLMGDNSKEYRNVNVSSELMSVLCLSQDPAIIWKDREKAQLVSSTLKSLISLKVSLEWSLQSDKDADILSVESVFLPSLDC